MTETTCPKCGERLAVTVLLERVAAGASSNLPSSGAPQTPLKDVYAGKLAPVAFVPDTPQQGSLASVTDQKLSDDLDALPWVWNSKHSGHLTDWMAIAQQTRAALALRMTPEKNETWRYGQYSYSRFRTDAGRELLSRFPVKLGERGR